ncbi:DNA mismatch repair protein MutT [Chitinophaga flava]|uniref:GDP-mannose pyrophosphatase n=2 Tax=Chitinophaga flava TaxID=2259036 RepID=A0A365Y0W4_9BACT|nr:DNA mismatch repair protein MutT [Chitinophaga flava]
MMNMDWTLLSSEYLFRDNWLTARKDRCLTPQGNIVEPYYVLEYSDWVNAVALTEDNQVIMIRQYRQGVGRTLLEIPGGTMDKTDPSPEFAMERELLEETGYAFKELIPMGKVAANTASSNNYTHMFLATGGRKVKEQDLDDNEEIEVVLMSIPEVQQLLMDNKIIHSLHVTGLCYALLHLGKMEMK